jgi:hypothetical protein
MFAVVCCDGIFPEEFVMDQITHVLIIHSELEFVGDSIKVGVRFKVLLEFESVFHGFQPQAARKKIAERQAFGGLVIFGFGYKSIMIPEVF